MRILIDNGHGIDTPGKRSPDGTLLEWKYTREIARRVVDELKLKGYYSKLLVPEDIDVSLRERVRRVNYECDKHGKSNVILVSIHCNAAGDGRSWMHARGWSAYTSKGQTKADELANCLYGSAKMFLTGLRIREDWQDMDPDWEESFYILRKTKCPAVLTENLFQDNQEDVKYLLSCEGKDDIVQVHVDGIINFLKKQ